MQAPTTLNHAAPAFVPLTAPTSVPPTAPTRVPQMDPVLLGPWVNDDEDGAELGVISGDDDDGVELGVISGDDENALEQWLEDGITAKDIDAIEKDVASAVDPDAEGAFERWSWDGASQVLENRSQNPEQAVDDVELNALEVISSESHLVANSERSQPLFFPPPKRERGCAAVPHGVLDEIRRVNTLHSQGKTPIIQLTPNERQRISPSLLERINGFNTLAEERAHWSKPQPTGMVILSAPPLTGLAERLQQFQQQELSETPAQSAGVSERLQLFQLQESQKNELQQLEEAVKAQLRLCHSMTHEQKERFLQQELNMLQDKHRQAEQQLLQKFATVAVVQPQQRPQSAHQQHQPRPARRNESHKQPHPRQQPHHQQQPRHTQQPQQPQPHHQQQQPQPHHQQQPRPTHQPQQPQPHHQQQPRHTHQPQQPQPHHQQQPRHTHQPPQPQPHHQQQPRQPQQDQQVQLQLQRQLQDQQVQLQLQRQLHADRDAKARAAGHY